MKELISATGEKHGLINTVANSSPDNGFKNFKPEDKVKAEKLRKEESRVVTARYINHRGPNERLDKQYCRWAGDQIQFWHFIPGSTYEVPYGMIKEVNDPKTRLAQRSEIIDAKGIPTKKDGQGEIIHEFVPIEF